MSEPAWSSFQRRIARIWGGEKTWRGESGSDARGAVVSLECKRRKGGRILSADVAQAKRQGKVDGKPWLLVVADHGARDALAVCSHNWLVALARQAGLLPAPLPGATAPCVECGTATSDLRDVRGPRGGFIRREACCPSCQ